MKKIRIPFLSNVNISYREIILVSVILFMGLFFHLRTIDKEPLFTHTWAQCDRYALALGFIDNGFNFFQPQTYNLNKQFPDVWQVPSESGVTSVDFPIHEYIIGLIMWLLNSTSPMIFRIYMLFFSLIGLFFLYKLSYIITESFIKSLFIVVFVATSPIFVYYQSGFLPAIPSLSCAIIALCYYFKLKKNVFQRKYLFISLIFFTVSALFRTTFLIPLLAVICVEILNFIRKKNSIKHFLLPATISILVIVSYYYYNAYLRSIHGSVFLGSFLPLKTYPEYKAIFLLVKERYQFTYFTEFQYYVYGLLLVLSLFFLFKNRFKSGTESNSLLLVAFVALLGCMMFSILMMEQFINHDYYFLDSFYLPFILILLAFISQIPNVKNNYVNGLYIIFVAFFGVLFFLKAERGLKHRQQILHWDRYTLTIKNFAGTDTVLDNNNVADTAKILAMDSYGPNIPFVQIKRPGYALMNVNRENIEKALTWDYDLVALQKEYFLSNVYIEKPEILNILEPVFESDAILFCKKRVSKDTVLINDFLTITNSNCIYRDSLNFDKDSISSKWGNVNVVKIDSLDNNFSHIDSLSKYGISYSVSNLKLKNLGRKNLLVKASFLFDKEIRFCELILVVNVKGTDILVHPKSIPDVVRKPNIWQKGNFLYVLPEILDNENSIGFYILNGENNLYVDDIELFLY
ncbi:MAG: hypothetical protein IPO21_01660 [Bacteroidales bacterium]|nr:hypothetical protein [Bacteroidales bacterium]